LYGRGHRITFYEPDAFERQQHRDMEDPCWAKVVVYQPDTAAIEAVLRRAGAADVIVKASGVGVYDALLEREVLALRRPGNRIIFWDVDAPATLERIRNDREDPFRSLIPRYDLIFTYGGGRAVVDEYLGWGARACVPIYNALDPLTHHPVRPDGQFAGLLGFLGNRLPDREQRVREFFLRPALDSPNEQFLLGGNGWESAPDIPENVHRLGHVYSRFHNAFNCTPRAVININRDSMARAGFSPPTRVFEAAGAGACLIMDAWEGIETFFEPDKEVCVAHDGNEVSDLLARLTPARAAEIGAAALRRVLGQHTYAQRALQVEATIEGKATGEIAA
jgi:spore maturation protein CgeB